MAWQHYPLLESRCGVRRMLAGPADLTWGLLHWTCFAFCLWQMRNPGNTESGWEMHGGEAHKEERRSEPREDIARDRTGMLQSEDAQEPQGNPGRPQQRRWQAAVANAGGILALASPSAAMGRKAKASCPLWLAQPCTVGKFHPDLQTRGLPCQPLAHECGSMRGERKDFPDSVKQV